MSDTPSVRSAWRLGHALSATTALAAAALFLLVLRSLDAPSDDLAVLASTEQNAAPVGAVSLGFEAAAPLESPATDVAVTATPVSVTRAVNVDECRILGDGPDRYAVEVVSNLAAELAASSSAPRTAEPTTGPSLDLLHPSTRRVELAENVGLEPPRPAAREPEISPVGQVFQPIAPAQHSAALDAMRSAWAADVKPPAARPVAPELSGVTSTPSTAGETPPPLLDQYEANLNDPYGVGPIDESAPGAVGGSVIPAPIAVDAAPQPLPPATNSPMPAPAAKISSAEMASVMQLANEHTHRGFALGSRAALFSARNEFMQALRLVAQALDVQSQTNVHSKALAAGWRALEESDDFIPREGDVEGDLDLAAIASSHQTPVLHELDATSLPALVALQRYYNYAQEQLALAGGHEPAASLALHGMARLHAVIGTRQAARVRAAEPKAIVLEQAALLVDGRNFMAANDLAVLLVRYGRLQEARALLQKSVTTFGQPESWRNLAELHQRMGEKPLADLANKAAGDAARQQARLVGGMPITGGPEVKWVEPGAFAGSAQVDGGMAGSKRGANPQPQRGPDSAVKRVQPKRRANDGKFGTRNALRDGGPAAR